jgi:hypothetical protein
MTTVVTTSNSEVTTPASYVSRWIAQSHGKYQRKGNEYYLSSCDCRTSINKTSMRIHTNSQITTWQAQAKSRLDVTTTTNTSDSSTNINNNELQEKLTRIR